MALNDVSPYFKMYLSLTQLPLVHKPHISKLLKLILVVGYVKKTVSIVCVGVKKMAISYSTPTIHIDVRVQFADICLYVWLISKSL